jgi:hypothetical protein
VSIKDVRVELKDGRVFYGPLYEIRPGAGWFTLSIDDADAPDLFYFKDCISVVNRGVQTAYNKIEDVDLITWAAKEIQDGNLDPDETVRFERGEERGETYELSDEDAARFEAAIAQADSERPPSPGSVAEARLRAGNPADVIFVCNGYMCGNVGYTGGKCGCCPDGVMVRYVKAELSLDEQFLEIQRSTITPEDLEFAAWHTWSSLPENLNRTIRELRAEWEARSSNPKS